MIESAIEGLVNWIRDTVMDFVLFMLSVLQNTTNTLLTNEVFLTLTGILTSIALTFATLGMIFAMYDWFNVKDDTNSQMKNTQILDYILPIIYSFVFSATFVSGSLALFRFTSTYVPMTINLINADRFDFDLETMLVNAGIMLSPTSTSFYLILSIVIIIIIIICSFDVFKEFVTKVPELLLILIVSTYKSFTIARGDYSGVFELVKKVIGLNLILTLKILFFVWGLDLIMSVNFTNMLLGIGIILAGKNSSKYLHGFIDTGANSMGLRSSIKGIGSAAMSGISKFT